MNAQPTGASDTLDEQDRIAILQIRTLTMDQRLNYFADEVEFEAAPVEPIGGVAARAYSATLRTRRSGHLPARQRAQRRTARRSADRTRREPSPRDLVPARVYREWLTQLRFIRE